MELIERHCVLVADREDCTLGHMALRLTRLGIDPIYTNDLDEAVLLAHENAQRLGAIVFPADLPSRQIDTLIKQVAERADIPPQTLVPVGPPPDDASVLMLRERGIRWAVWEPFREVDLRFVLATVINRGLGNEGRLEPRVPTERVTGMAYKGVKSCNIEIVDLAVTGAFLACDRPLPEGSKISLDLDLPGVRACRCAPSFAGPVATSRSTATISPAEWACSSRI